jgi:hypothetical protein
MKTLRHHSLALLLFAGLPGAAAAQVAPAGATPVQSGSERVNLVIVYGDDPCPKSDSGDIVVCGRKDEKERYRIPEPLRGDPNAPANQAWGKQFQALEYVGRSGTDSCSPVGAGGFTGCFAQLARFAKAERKEEANASWADVVAAERARRLGRIDSESEEVEARVKAEEAAEAKATGTVPPAPAGNDGNAADAPGEPKGD